MGVTERSAVFGFCPSNLPIIVDKPSPRQRSHARIVSGAPFVSYCSARYASGARSSGSVWLGQVSNREKNHQFRWAVQYPEQRAPPEWPLHVPRPELRESRPEPDAYLSGTATEAWTTPVPATWPLNLTRLGCVMASSVMLTEKL